MVTPGPDVLVVPAEAIDPTHNKRVAAAKQVEQSAALGSLGELGVDAGDACVADDLIEPEAGLLGVGVLVSMVCSLVLTRP